VGKGRTEVACCRRWHRAGGGCGWWWRRSGEEEGAGTDRSASMCGGEGWFVQCGGGVVRPCVGGDSQELGLGVALRDLGWAFIGAGGGMAAWARAIGEGPSRGQNQGCSCLAGTDEGSPWCQQRPRQKKGAGWRLPEGEA
jgi:hypothetical protein